MKTATKRLEEDHLYILRLTDVIDHFAESRATGPEQLEEIVELIKGFADGIHHSREEGIFFPFLAKRGFPVSGGPVAVMLNEHAAGRNFVVGMTENIALFRQGNKEAPDRIFFYMKSYSALLKAHIAKENNVLFPMADRALSEDDQSYLESRFIQSEEESPSDEFKRRIASLETLFV